MTAPSCARCNDTGLEDFEVENAFGEVIGHERFCGCDEGERLADIEAARHAPTRMRRAS